MLSNTEASYSNEESFFQFEGTQNLPTAMCVTMCDGTTAQKNVVGFYWMGVIHLES